MSITQAEVTRRVVKMYTDIYEGEGKDNPPVITRLSRLEDAIADIKKMKWALIIAALAAVSDIVASHWH
jgi:hypothetical protein